MKNLFFTAIAIIAFGFAGNARNFITSNKTIKNSFEQKINKTDVDCTWTVIKTKISRQINADGTMSVTTVQVWACI